MALLFLLTGYKRTGKDFFYKALSSSHSPVSFAIYAQDSDKALSLLRVKDLQRAAFAERLKEEASEFFRIEFSDETKDLPLRDLQSTRRDLLKIWGAYRTRKDPLFWCKVLRYPKDLPVMITDWRFEKEFHYMKPSATIRIFRRAIPIPCEDDDTERALDHQMTDLLVVPLHEHEQEFAAANSHFRGIYDNHRIVASYP